MADETTEQYSLVLTAQDNASGTVNQLNSALTQTLAGTEKLTISSAEFLELMSSPAAAQQLGVDADAVADINKELQIGIQETELLGEKTEGLLGKYLRGKDAADGFLLELEKIQQSESASNPTGLLGMGDAAVSLGFMQSLAAIQAQEASTQGGVTDQLVAQNEQLEVQGALTQRLADAALARESAETGVVAQLREEAFAAQQVAEAGGGDEGGGGGIGVGGLRSGLRAGGFLLGADAGGGTLRAAGQIATLSAVLGPVGVIAGVAAVALREAADAEQKRAEAAKQYISAVGNVADQTTGQIQTNIDQQQQQLNAYKGAQQTLQGLADQADDLSRRAALFPWQEGALNQEQYLAALDGVDKKTSEATGGIITDAAGLTDALKEGQTQIDKTQGSINFLGLAIGSVDTASNNAAAAATRHGELILKEADAEQQADSLLASERQKKIDDIQHEIDADQRLIESGQLTADQSSDLTDKIRDLKAEQRGYADVVDSTADALERATTATNSTLDLLTQEGDVRDKIAGTEADIAQTRQEAAEKAADLLSTEQDKIADIQETGGEKRAEIELNTQTNIAKIARDSGQDLYNDVALRDAEKYTLDKQKEQNQLADQATSEKKALDSQAVSETKSINQAQAAYQKSEQQLEVSLGKELATKNLVLTREQTDLQNILAGELALSQQYGVGIVNAWQQTGQAVLSFSEQVAAGVQYNLRAAAGGSTAPVPYSTFSAPGYTPAPLPVASGGGTQGAINGRSLTVNVNGLVSDSAAALVVNQTLHYLNNMM